MQENANPIIVGRIGGVYGVRGWLKVESHTRPKENIFTYSPWLIHIDLEWKEVQIEKFQQRGNGRLLLKIKGIILSIIGCLCLLFMSFLGAALRAAVVN